MRLARVQFKNQPTVHHCTSRLIPEVGFLSFREQRALQRRIRKIAAFGLICVINYTVMGNHYHTLTRTPKKVRLTNAKLLRKLRTFYGRHSAQALEFQDALEHHPNLLPGLRRQYLARMGQISVFHKELKEGFARSFNRRHERRGPLWACRFYSQIVEDHPLCLLAVSAYIDLNALRARLVSDPKDYPFCGYAEAVGGGRLARAGLAQFLPPGRWSQRLAHYRTVLYGEGATARHSGKRMLTPEEVAQVLARGGKLTLPQVLRCRVKYLTRGGIVGSKEFVERVWRECYAHMSPKRKSGARKMKGAEWGGLHVMRDLQKDVIG